MQYRTPVNGNNVVLYRTPIYSTNAAQDTPIYSTNAAQDTPIAPSINCKNTVQDTYYTYY